jgi:capsular polysaccharide export protein
MTRYRQTRSASFPVPDEFEAFYEANRERGAEMLHAVQDITRTQRSTHGLAERLPEAETCLERIVAWRGGGGKVACLFGKVVCDSGVPIDGGPAHANMKDWLNHAIESVRNSDTLLLIKPHPHEIRNEIGLFMTEHFFDLIESELPDNVILLGHRWFDVRDLDGLIDLGVVYSGTSAVEFGVLGIPCVLSGRYAPIDYPIGHAVTKSREHFRRLLRFEEEAVVSPDLSERSAAWLTFMSGDGVAHDYRYHARQITNKRVFPPWWFREDIERYQSQGDRSIELLVAEILATGPGTSGLEAAE